MLHSFYEQGFSAGRVDGLKNNEPDFISDELSTKLPLSDCDVCELDRGYMEGWVDGNSQYLISQRVYH